MEYIPIRTIPHELLDDTQAPTVKNYLIFDFTIKGL